MLLLVYLRKYYKKSKLNLGVFDTTQIETIVNKNVMFHYNEIHILYNYIVHAHELEMKRDVYIYYH